MTAKIIELRKPARSTGETTADSIRIEKGADRNVLVTVAGVEFTLTPAHAKQIGEHLTVLAIVLGEDANG